MPAHLPARPNLDSKPPGAVWCWRLLVLGEVTAPAAAGRLQTSPSQKLDATLAAIADDASGRLAAQSGLVRYEPGCPEPLVATILRFEGSLDAVKAQGAVVRSVIGDIATVDIPVRRLDESHRPFALG